MSYHRLRDIYSKELTLKSWINATFDTRHVLQELKLPCLAHVLEDPEVFLFLGVLDWADIRNLLESNDSKLKINKNAFEMEYEVKWIIISLKTERFHGPIFGKMNRTPWNLRFVSRSELSSALAKLNQLKVVKLDMGWRILGKNWHQWKSGGEIRSQANDQWSSWDGEYLVHDRVWIILSGVGLVVKGGWWTNDQWLASVGKWHEDNRQCFRFIRTRLSKNGILDCFVNNTGRHLLDFTCIIDCHMIELLLCWLNLGFSGTWNVALLWLMTADDIDARIQYDLIVFSILLGQMNSENLLSTFSSYLTMDANRTLKAPPKMVKMVPPTKWHWLHGCRGVSMPTATFLEQPGGGHRALWRFGFGHSD